MQIPLPLFRVYDLVNSFFLEAESFYADLDYFVSLLPAVPDEDVPKVHEALLKRIHWLGQQGRELMNSSTDNSFWLYRRAHSQVFPGKILRDRFASYHDLAYWEAEGFLSSLQCSTPNTDEDDREVVVRDDWPTAFHTPGIMKALEDHQNSFDELNEIQGYLEMEAATAASICPEAAIETGAGGSEEKPPNDITSRESTILEALSDKTMPAKDLSVAAGYQNNSSFRSTLSNLYKRGHLEKCDDGYLRPVPSH